MDWASVIIFRETQEITESISHVEEWGEFNSVRTVIIYWHNEAAPLLYAYTPALTLF